MINTIISQQDTFVVNKDHQFYSVIQIQHLLERNYFFRIVFKTIHNNCDI